jgi:hypothetical protein
VIFTPKQYLTVLLVAEHRPGPARSGRRPHRQAEDLQRQALETFQRIEAAEGHFAADGRCCLRTGPQPLMENQERLEDCDARLRVGRQLSPGVGSLSEARRTSASMYPTHPPSIGGSAAIMFGRRRSYTSCADHAARTQMCVSASTRQPPNQLTEASRSAHQVIYQPASHAD